MKDFLQFLIVLIQIRIAQMKGKNRASFSDLSDKTKERLKRKGFRLFEPPCLPASRSIETDVLWYT